MYLFLLFIFFFLNSVQPVYVQPNYTQTSSVQPYYVYVNSAGTVTGTSGSTVTGTVNSVINDNTLSQIINNNNNNALTTFNIDNTSTITGSPYNPYTFGGE